VQYLRSNAEQTRDNAVSFPVDKYPVYHTEALAQSQVSNFISCVNILFVPQDKGVLPETTTQTDKNTFRIQSFYITARASGKTNPA
jgi:hypothetical protein